MTEDVAVLKTMYDRFNARDIDGVLASLAERVEWANGMDGATFTAGQKSENTGRASGPS